MTLITPERNQAAGHVDPAAAYVPDQSRAERRTSFEVADFPVPHGREEEWRFTPVDRLGNVFSDTPTDDREGDPAATFDATEVEAVLAEPLGPGAAPRGTVLVPADRAAVVASANTDQALHLKLAADTVYDEPLRLRIHGNGAGRRSNAHYVLEAGPHSQGLVILEHTGSAEHTGNLEVIVGDGANLTVVTLQQWEDDAHHLGQHDALVGRDAAYRHIAVTLGGAIVRVNSNVRYAGPGGEATLLGVYFADAGQHLEHRSFVDHNAPRCTSLVTYKGALQGDTAHTVWVGDVLIRKEAEGIETYELNRNLVLTDGARADSVPNLEIETGEIAGAGHASSTGRFDDEQLFYLMARGIPEAEARKLVVRGFFADIVARIGVPEVVDTLMAAIEAELAATGS
ncbi:Fe-S cluster assembly protein SufD [Calidifontibacter sp. DB0510]|uniref:Fe-S cluster assembly protein SufD n=1 Tax=Metallococcus carri TaxID=1656884 RepID=A0A967AY58_9MICO|nr:Fe-S cluster assembly protein SufD [Metallococcus carri]NHN54893.1 Fe-S cluster assembly protein SufD [Metallococcus carri]NOP37238.1 Fe-S cluster assembly protein SufD [Calidifontibacter sp. DB2511S]